MAQGACAAQGHVGAGGTGAGLEQEPLNFPAPPAGVRLTACLPQVAGLRGLCGRSQPPDLRLQGLGGVPHHGRLLPRLLQRQGAPLPRAEAEDGLTAPLRPAERPAEAGISPSPTHTQAGTPASLSALVTTAAGLGGSAGSPDEAPCCPASLRVLQGFLFKRKFIQSVTSEAAGLIAVRGGLRSPGQPDAGAGSVPCEYVVPAIYCILLYGNIFMTLFT